MKSSTITVLVVAGAVAVLLYVMRPKAPPRQPSSNTLFGTAAGGIVSGLVSLGSNIAALTKTPDTTPNLNPAGVTDQNWDTYGIDPETGGVNLAPGQTYGPPLPYPV
jgi:hypothetical protein